MGMPTPKEPTIGLLGDTHANLVWTVAALDHLCYEEGVDVVVQLGDFGWWPQSEFAKRIAQYAGSYGITLLFLDGNHEDHHSLRARVFESNPDHDGLSPVELYSNLWYLPRGCTWAWNGVKFMSFGGAFSIDYEWRVRGVSWFEEEEPSDAEINRAIEQGPVDVLLTHDHPNFGYKLLPPIEQRLEDLSIVTRNKLRKLWDAVEPDLCIHGHWHKYYRRRVHGKEIIGLDRDKSDFGVATLELETLELELIDVPLGKVYSQ